MTCSILLASDMGPYNDQMMLQASLFAGDQAGKVSIIHVVDPDRAAAGLVVGNYLSGQLDHYSAINDLERMVVEIGDQIRAVATDYLGNTSNIDVRIGAVAPTILDHARKTGADLIVVGHPVGNDNAKLRLLLDQSRIPVLVLPIVKSPLQ